MVLVMLQLLFVLLGSGVSAEQMLFHKQVTRYLPNSVIATSYAESELECSILCTRRKGCLSVNYKANGHDRGLCELNDKTISKEVAVPDADFVYLGVPVKVCIILQYFLKGNFFLYVAYFRLKVFKT
jgi:hypothetical protein